MKLLHLLEKIFCNYPFMLSSLLLFIFIPSFFIKASAILTLIIILYHKIMSRNYTIKKFWVGVSLFIIFYIAFLFTPYWIIPQNMIINTIYFIVLLGIGILWAYYASGDVKFRNNRNNISDKFIKNKNHDMTDGSHYVWFIILFITLFLIQYPLLNNDIASVGDESAHITGAKIITSFVIKSYNYLLSMILPIFSNNFVLLTMAFLIALGVIILLGVYVKKYFFKRNHGRKNKSLTVSRYSKRFILLLLSLAVIASYVITYLYKNFFYTYIDDFLRYPFIIKYLHVLSVFPDPFNISLYRLVPFVSYVLISWIVFYELRNILIKEFKNRLISNVFSYLLTIGIMTVPLMYFFGGILYIELPMILLMTVTIIDIKFFLTVDYKELLQRPSWYAFLMIGFIKESAVIILIPIIMVRFFYKNIYLSFVNKRSIQKFSIKQIIYKIINTLFKKEIGLYMLMLMPITLYLFFRLFFGDPRPYGFEAYNFLNILSYWFFIKGILLQFGIILIFAIIGMYFLLRKQKISGYTFLFFILFVAAFFICDIYIYIGYSRWNLFIAPIIIISFVAFIDNLITNINNKKRAKKKFLDFRISSDTQIKATIYLSIVIVIILASNLLLKPVEFDGSRNNWGCINCPDTDRTYPYMASLKPFANKNIDNLYVIGQDIPNQPEIEFYLEKYNITANVTISQYVIPASQYNSISDLIYNNMIPDIALKNGDTMLYLSKDIIPEEMFIDIKYQKFSNMAYNIYVITI